MSSPEHQGLPSLIPGHVFSQFPELAAELTRLGEIEAEEIDRIEQERGGADFVTFEDTQRALKNASQRFELEMRGQDD